MSNLSQNNTTEEVGMGNPFARSNKLGRSPTKATKISQRGAAKKNVETILNKGRGELSRMEHAVQLATELSKLVQAKTNIHSEIKALVMKVDSAIKGAQRDYQLMVTQQATQSDQQATQETWGTPAAATPTTASKRGRSPQESTTTPVHPKRPKNTQSAGKPKEEWTVVGKKPGRRKERPTKKVRPKADALIISAKEGGSYADILRKVQTDPSLKELGEQVVRVRRTRNNEILLELKLEEGVKSATFKPLLDKVVGEEGTIKALSQEVIVEVIGMEEFSTEQDLRKALKEQCGIDGEPIIRLRKAPRATQTGSVKLPVDSANALFQMDSIKVGWSVCEIRTPQPTRCFKCSGFGHQAKNCKGEDRTKACWKCGEDGHKGRDCKNAPKCFLCSETDGKAHVAGSLKCRTYKEAVAKKRWK